MTKKPNQNFVVIDTKSGTYSGFVGNKSEAIFKTTEGVSGAFLEEFRRNPKATLDEAEKEPPEPQEGPYKASDEGPYHQVVGLVEKYVAEHNLGWDKFDSQPTQRIVETALQCVMAHDLEGALAGLLYITYQARIQYTNKADSLLSKLQASSPTDALPANEEEAKIDSPEPPERA